MGNEELIEKLRLMAFESLDNDEATMLHEAADALEAKAAPVGDDLGHDTKGSRKALGAIAQLSDEQIFDIAEPFGEFRYGDAQGDNRIAFARAIVAALSYTPQPSAGVVMPGRAEVSVRYGYRSMGYAEGWNACLDEFARLNGKEVGRG